MKFSLHSLAFTLGLALLAGCAGVSNRPVVPSLSGQSGGSVRPGDFVWHDLITPDAPAALTFYGDLFSWEFRSSNEGYFEIYSDGELIGGIVDATILGTVPETALWLNSIASQDVRIALDRIKDAGGKPLSAVGVLPNRGTVVQLEDPNGAIVQLVQIQSKDRLPDPGIWIWHELLTENPEESALWYGALSGVEVAAALGEEQFNLVNGNTPVATISQSPFEEARSVWVPVLAVEDVDDFVRRVSKHGGRVVIGPDSELSDGTIAVVLDPSGGVFAVQSK
tara:strand:+ start:19562 stop:20401 length:840 start_codon:yes stop_codon:yes gene_type:complete